MISVFGSHVGPDELREVEQCIDAQWLGQGARCAAFEEGIRVRLGLDNFLFVDSGSNALFMAVELLELPPGSEVIVPTFTWVACAQAVLLAGHRPVFCDVDPDTQNATVDTIRDRMTSKTGAIMVVHYAGKPVDLEPILALGLPVIEDAAHAIDSRQGGVACGARGDVGIYSFDAVKNLTTGLGGGLTVRDAARAERAKKLRYCGIGKSGFQAVSTDPNRRWWEYDISDVFIRMVPADVNAAIGLAQLKRLDDLQGRRRAIWERYQAAFSSVDAIRTPIDAAADERHSYFTYFIRIPERDRVARALLDQEIYTTLRFHPLHLNAKYGASAPLPNAEALNECGLNIPLHPRLSDDDVEQVIDAIVALVR